MMGLHIQNILKDFSMLQAVLSNWGNEFAKWAPDIAAVMYDGSPEERKQLQRDFVEKGTFNVLITHYDLIMRDKSALRKVLCRAVLCCAALMSAATSAALASDSAT